MIVAALPYGAMTTRPRPFGSLLGIAAGCAVGWGIYHLMLIGSCSTPAGPGEVPCPPGSEQYFFALFFGILVAVGATIAGGSWLAFYALFAGIGVGGIAAGMSDSPGSATWFVFFGLCFLLTPLVGLVALPIAGLKKLKAARLTSGGIPAVGTVLAIEDTGVTLNNNPRLRVRFRIEPSNGIPPYEATKTATVPRVQIPRVGDRYPLWLDPNDPNSWVFANADAAAAPATPASLRQIVDLARHGARPAIPPPPVTGSTEVVGELGRLNELRLAGALSAEEFATRTNALLRSP
jgi:hypothetical protein